MSDSALQQLPDVAVGLVHWPAYDRLRKLVATNITNFDIHDIARACRTFGVKRYYLIHPMQDQQMFVSRILEHWRTGYGARYNPMRQTALTDVAGAISIDEALRDWGRPQTRLIATSARAIDESPQVIGFRDLREQIKAPQASTFLLFGTGFGLSDEVVRRCDGVLEPIRGAPPQDYRHLSVRSAVSICLDRLLGAW
jgi:hypothetical protein